MDVVLIGAGNIAGAKETVGPDINCPAITHIQAIINSPDFDLVGVVDKDIHRAEALLKKWRVSAGAYSSVDDIRETPCGFIVATPPETHLQVITDIFGSHFKPEFILLEKPGGSTLREAEQIFDLCRSNNCAIFLNYQRNYSSLQRKISEYIGAVSSMRVDYCRGISNDGSHALALFLAIANTPFQNIRPHMETVVHDLPGDPTPHATFSLGAIPVTLVPHDGRKYDIFRMEFFGEHGAMLCEQHGSNISVMQIVSEKVYGNYKTLDAPAFRESIDFSLENVYAVIANLRKRDHEYMMYYSKALVNYIDVWRLIDAIIAETERKFK